MARDVELEDEISFFGRNHARAIDRALKRALAREKDKALKGGKSGIKLPHNTLRAARRAYTRVAVKAVIRAASAPRESARPDLGTGRSFHLKVDPLMRNPDGGRPNKGKAAASGRYIERENAVEIGEIDLAEFIDRQRDEHLQEEFGLSRTGRYQGVRPSRCSLHAAGG